MFQSSISIARQPPSHRPYSDDYLQPFAHLSVEVGVNGLSRRWQRMRRRRKVGRAYDMALEVFRALPNSTAGMRVLDVGCGSGYIAHHLSSMLATQVDGIDLAPATEAPINYRPFDGAHFPAETSSLDLVLFCYVLHHAQNLTVLLQEMKRVLRPGGKILVYEDIPETSWDRIVCSIHDLKWRRRTGPCTFKTEDGWRKVFAAEGFEGKRVRRLSRFRNMTHPVSRRMFLFESTAGSDGEERSSGELS